MQYVIGVMLLLATYAVVRVFGRIRGQRRHAERAELRELVTQSGDLGERRKSEITAHLGICERCRELMAEVIKEA